MTVDMMHKQTEAEKITEMWKNTTPESDIYYEMNEIRRLVKNSGISRKEFQIKEKLAKSVSEKNIDALLLYLNEYELIYGADTDIYKYYENLATPMYNAKLLSERRPNCKLFDDAISSKNQNITHYKNLHKGERCFIIGNGPSLNKLDLTQLKEEVTFGVNSIFLNYDKMGFNPTYYTVEDYHVINERADAIKKIKGSIKFIPQYAYKSFGDREDVIYINTIPDYRRYKGYPYFSTDIKRRVWVGGTVSYINLQLAYYMGFEEVYLIGFDHNYIIPSSANISGANIVSTEDDPNHFHPDYFGKGFSWHIPLTERMELCYIKAKYAFEQSNKKIMNATAGGYLEVFPRIDFDSVIASHKKIPQKNDDVKKNYDVSVIIPAYNAEDTLVPSIESVLRQDNVYCEIIIVDDGSTDNTSRIAKEYSSNFENIFLIQQENKGLGGARNTGIENATAPYITFLDSDDTFNKDILSNSLNKQRLLDLDIIMFDYARIKNGKDIKGTSNYLKCCGFEGLFSLLSGFSLAATCRIYKKELLVNNSILFPEHRYHEDITFVMKAYYYAKKVSYYDSKGYNWIFREGSITSHLTEHHIESMFLNLCDLKDFLIKEDIFEKSFRRYLVFCFRMTKLLLDRILSITDINIKTKLLRKLRKMMEDIDLDFYEYIQIASSNNKEVVSYVFDRLFYYRVTQQPSSPKDVSKSGAPKAVAPKEAPKAVAPKEAPKAVAPKEAPKAVAPKEAAARIDNLKRRIIRTFIFNEHKVKKFDKNPRIFFEDARPPFHMLKHLF